MKLYAVFRNDEQLTSPQPWGDACWDAAHLGDGCEVMSADAAIPIALRRTYLSLDEVKALYPHVRKPGDRHREAVDLPLARGEQPYDEYELKQVDASFRPPCLLETAKTPETLPIGYRFVLVEQWR